MLKPVATILTALSVATVPVAAQAQSAGRQPAPVENARGLGGSNPGGLATPLLLFVVGAAAVAALILLDSSDEAPVSP